MSDPAVLVVLFAGAVPAFGIGIDSYVNRIPFAGREPDAKFRDSDAFAWALSGWVVGILVVPIYLIRRNRILRARQISARLAPVELVAKGISQYKQLLDQGAITTQEFEKAKIDLLASLPKKKWGAG